MQDDKLTLHRRSLRLNDFDYRTPGAYFVTICTHERQCLFGEVVDGAMRLSTYGQVAEREWLRSGKMRREVMLDEYVVMPNHVHGIVFLVEGDDSFCGGAEGVHWTPLHPDAQDGEGANLRIDIAHAGNRQMPLQRHPTRSLGAMINGYKAAVTRDIRILSGAPDQPVWQRNYYEHVIRNEHDLDSVRQYIRNNPARWTLDRENPDHVGKV